QDRDHNWFNDDWWRNHPVSPNWWHYRWGAYHPWNYWWTVPTSAALGAWLGSAGSGGGGYYYDYGDGGNVNYQGDQVYVNDQPVGTADEYSQSAAQLASVDPPATENQAKEAEWLPLGTFALSTGENDTDSSRVVQLAVDHEGIVSGTMYNTQTDQT